MQKVKKQMSVILLTGVLSASLMITGCQDTNKVEDTQTIPKEEASDRIVKITDMNGREVEIPSSEELERVYYTDLLGELMVYTVNPEKMVGLVSELNEEQLEFMPEAKDLKVINIEDVKDKDIQVLISVESTELDEKSKQSADELQEKLGVPVVVVDGQFEKRADAYRFLGQVFDEEERSEKLALYCEETLVKAETKTKDITEVERVSVYYAKGKDGLQTESEISSDDTIFKYTGATNVADLEVTPDSGTTSVTMDQIIGWNPNFIFMDKDENNTFEEIAKNKSWSQIDAVKKGKVYEIPNIPFSWSDSSSSQQYLALRYVNSVTYPELFNYDMTTEVEEFFKLFYQVDISAEDANIILEKRLSE